MQLAEERRILRLWARGYREAAVQEAGRVEVLGEATKQNRMIGSVAFVSPQVRSGHSIQKGPSVFETLQVV